MPNKIINLDIYYLHIRHIQINGNCRKQGTTGWNFPHRSFGFGLFCECAQQYLCQVYAKFHGFSCMVPGYRFGGGAYRFTVFRAHISDKNSGNNTKVIFNHVDRIYGPDEDQMNWIWLKSSLPPEPHVWFLFYAMLVVGASKSSVQDMAAMDETSVSFCSHQVVAGIWWFIPNTKHLFLVWIPFTHLKITMFVGQNPLYTYIHPITFH